MNKAILSANKAKGMLSHFKMYQEVAVIQTLQY